MSYLTNVHLGIEPKSFLSDEDVHHHTLYFSLVCNQENEKVATKFNGILISAESNRDL